MAQDEVEAANRAGPAGEGPFVSRWAPSSVEVEVEVSEDVYVSETESSFEDFYYALFQRLFTALCMVTGNRHEAEEVAQEAFVYGCSSDGTTSACSRIRPATCSGFR